MADPFTDILGAIWTTLEDHNVGADSFASLVPDGYRMKLSASDARVGQFQPTPRAGAYPMVHVWLDGGRSQTICSSGEELLTVWMFDIKFADQRPPTAAFPVMWAVYRAMAASRSPGSTMRSLTFGGLGKVADCHLTRFDTKYGLFAQGGQMEGWRTMWAYEIPIVFTSSALPP